MNQRLESYASLNFLKLSQNINSTRRHHTFAARNESKQRLRGAATYSRRVLNATKLPDLLPSGSRRLPSVRGATRDSKTPICRKQHSKYPKHPNTYQCEHGE